MRLPQSITSPFCTRVCFGIGVTVFLAMLSLGAQAATQQLTCNPAALHFGDVPTGQSETQLVTLTNSGQTTVTVSAITLSATEFSMSQLGLPLTLTAGESVTLTMTFSPSATGWTGGRVIFNSTASNPVLQLTLGGTGVTSDVVTANPASLSFGQVAVGSKSTQPVVLTNNRSWKVTLSSFQTTGSGFSVSGLTLPLTLGVGQSVAFDVTFAPQTAGLTGGSVFVSGPALNVPFSGTGATAAGQLTLTPAALNFGNVTVGQTATQTVALNATGGTITISSISSGNAQFSVPGVSLPLTVNPGGSVAFNVAYTPLNTGTASSALSFSSNATNSPVSESLAGTGAAPYVALSWNPSTSQVIGYNVYRRLLPSGSYAKLNSTVDAIPSFTDTTVALGQTYDYATTAVNSSGEESGYSNQVEVVIP
jgi:Abnormal spindle-like microcephaly-assoc'd, ASPM-SPD-2-Hydin